MCTCVHVRVCRHECAFSLSPESPFSPFSFCVDVSRHSPADMMEKGEGGDHGDDERCEESMYILQLCM